MDIINEWISQIILSFTERATGFWENITLLDISLWQIVLDILIVALIFYYIFKLLRGSRAMHIITGLVIIGAAYLVSQVLELFALKWLLDRFFTFLIIAIPIIFQKELRRGLEKLGQQSNFFKAKRQKELDVMINEVVSACSVIRGMKKGALIVLKKKDSLNEYIETGVILDSRLSKELLVSIFAQKSPLHDGAVIIEEGRIRAAACVLPHSFKKYSGNFGTRHKAAIGLSSIADAIVLIVSEERGSMAIARNEKLQTVEEEEMVILLKRYLSENLKNKPE